MAAAKLSLRAEESAPGASERRVTQKPILRTPNNERQNRLDSNETRLDARSVSAVLASDARSVSRPHAEPARILAKRRDGTHATHPQCTSRPVGVRWLLAALVRRRSAGELRGQRQRIRAGTDCRRAASP